jgi:hypothetical protein
MKKKIQIFISSTFTDLIEERQAAVSAILKAGHIPAGMELFTAGDESQMETIKRWIDQSDVFMLVLGGRYGSIEPTTGLSYTELEYDYAAKSGKPYFAVVIRESALDQKVKEQGKGVIETENTKELSAFRAKVLSRTSAFFGNVQDIKLAVFETVADLLVRHDFKGWVSGDEIPDIQSYIDQINKLREENKRLVEDRNSLSAGAVFTASEENDFQYLLNRLNRHINIRYDISRKKTEDIPQAKIGEEVYKVHLLAALIHIFNAGVRHFEVEEINYHLSDALNREHSTEDGATRTPNIANRFHGRNSATERIDIELLTYDLVEQIYTKVFDRQEITFKFAPKMNRFKYWLEYSGQTPELHFEIESRTEVPVPEPPPPKVEAPALPTIKQIDRSLSFKAQRNNWRTSRDGVKVALREFKRLRDELSRGVKVSNSQSENFKIDYRDAGKTRCRVEGMGVGLSISWICERADTLEGSELTVAGEKKPFNVDGVQSFTHDETFYGSDYDIDLSRDLKIIWYRRGDRHTFSSSELADDLLTTLIKAIHKRVTSEE